MYFIAMLLLVALAGRVPSQRGRSRPRELDIEIDVENAAPAPT
jgi:hypothetical protein